MQKDIIVIGAGPAALSFVRSMRNSHLQITVLEQAPENAIAEPEYDGRDIALTHASRELLRDLDVWQQFDPQEIYPISKACVVDGDSPYSLDFDSQQKSYDALGFIISNHIIRQTLYEATKTQTNLSIAYNSNVSEIAKIDEGYKVSLADGQSFETKLLVAADSRFSKTRSQAGISADINDFARTAIVARMQHQASNQHTAFECFQYGHTLAVLPLGEKQSSVVVTANTDKANQLLKLGDEAFIEFVQHNLKHRLGDMTFSSKRFNYPLVGVHARQFIKPHFALIGDAAVGMHPVTAHGFNLGLSSAYLFARQIINALDNDQDYTTEKVLKGYQNRHMMETRIMYYGTNGVVKLFTDEHLPAKLARKAVLRLSNLLPPIKWAIEKKLTDVKHGSPF
ncbi:MAG: 5-demethoxyubiquinol-8 5-hydroxylase UbiM [Gammaproteobacteria bacterium]|nr:5-demethoxyubiquinol-8 5-hydroxylase UbiM [Gammaproteobacteria bacterium]